MVTGPSKMMTGPALRQGATTGQIEDFVGLSGAAFARCLMSLIARFRRLTELACRPRRRNAEAYLISAANGDSEFLRLGWRSMVTGPSKMMTGPALRQGATTGQIEDFVGLSGAAFARCLMSLIARFRRLTELACRPRRRNAEAYLISAAARPAAQS